MKSIILMTIYLLFFNSIILCFAKPVDYSIYGRLNDRRQNNDEKVNKPSVELLRRFNDKLNREEELATLQRSIEKYMQNEANQRAQGVIAYDPNYPLEDQQPLTLDYLEPNNANDYVPEETNPGDINYLDQTDNGIWLDGQVIPQATSLDSDMSNDEMDNVLLNYLYDQYIKTYGSDTLPLDDFEDDNALSFEKRRQKIVIKDVKRQEQDKGQSSSTTTTTSTIKPIVKKMAMKAANRGQKEVPLLRPAEVKAKDKWPAELELADEETEKEMSFEKSRPVRDVFTEQLDMLKKGN